MTILTPNELREHVETDLSDAALFRILSAAEQRIVDVAGEHPAGTLSEYIDRIGALSPPTRRIYLARKIATVVEIRERDFLDDDETTLASDDWRKTGSREIVRLREGTNSRLYWAPFVAVDYTAVDDMALRRQAQIDLAKIALANEGYQRGTSGDFSFTGPDLKAASDAALAPLRGGGRAWPLA